MRGHHEGSKIMQPKGPGDAKQSRILTKLIKEITVAARTGGTALHEQSEKHDLAPSDATWASLA